MNKLLIIVSILMLAGCIAGNFGEERERLYKINSDEDICAQYPERCINGVVW